MADEVVTKVKIKGDSTDAQRAVKDFEQASTKSFVTAQLAAQALSAAFGKAVEFAKSAAAAVADYDRTVEEQERALKNAGQEVKAWREELDKQSGSLQKLAGVSDEVIRELQTVAINMGVMPSKATGFTEAAIRMSRVLKMDVNSAMQQLTMTLGGQAGRLTRVIPAMKELTAEQLAAGGAADFVNERWEESLRVSDNLSGRVDTLRESWGDYVEAVGLAANKTKKLDEALEATNTTLETMTRVLMMDGGGVLESLASAFDIAFFGGERTTKGLESADARAGRYGNFDAETMARLEAQGNLSEKELAALRQAEADKKAPKDRKRDRPRLRPPKPKLNGKRSALDKAQDANALDMGDEMLALEEAFQAEQNRILESNEQQRLEITQSAAALKMQLIEDQYSYQADLERQLTAETKAEVARRVSVAEDQLDTFSSIAEIGTSVITDAITAFAEGTDEAIAEFFLKYAGMLGQQLIADGTANILKSVAMNAAVPGTGVALMGAGIAEVAFGTTLTAGSAIASAAMGAGNSAVSQSNSTAGSTGTGTGGAGGALEADRARASNITVVVYGEPNARTGKFIKKAIEEANNRGV